MAQPETGGMRTTEDDDDELETPSDDEEITIPSQDSADIRKVDIRNEQLENTQREDWLLPTEPRHGVHPRQTGAEHPPAMEDSVFRDAADISAVRHPNGTLRLSPRRRKCHGSTELLVGNNITKCLRQLYGRTAGIMILQPYSYSLIWREMR